MAAQVLMDACSPPCNLCSQKPARGLDAKWTYRHTVHRHWQGLDGQCLLFELVSKAVHSIDFPGETCHFDIWRTQVPHQRAPHSICSRESSDSVEAAAQQHSHPAATGCRCLWTPQDSLVGVYGPLKTAWSVSMDPSRQPGRCLWTPQDSLGENPDFLCQAEPWSSTGQGNIPWTTEQAVDVWLSGCWKHQSRLCKVWDHAFQPAGSPKNPIWVIRNIWQAGSWAKRSFHFKSTFHACYSS